MGQNLAVQQPAEYISKVTNSAPASLTLRTLDFKITGGQLQRNWVVNFGGHGHIALCCCFLLAGANAQADSPPYKVLGFEEENAWELVEGVSSLAQTPEASVGEGALEVTGHQWRRIATRDLTTIGAASNMLRLDVKPTSTPAPWESIGIVLTIPSKGVWWHDLGTSSLSGFVSNHFRTLAFPVSEGLRSILNQDYPDLTIYVSVNTAEAVVLDNLTLLETGQGSLQGSSGAVTSNQGLPIWSPPAELAECSDTALVVEDLNSDFRDIWLGNEVPSSGKQSWRFPPVTLDFSSPVAPNRVRGVYFPVDCEELPTAAITTNLSNYWSETSTELGNQRYPRDFSIFVRSSVVGVADAEGPVGAGDSISLTSFSVNQSAGQSYGLISGGASYLSGGSISGNVRHGSPSLIAPTSTITGGTAEIGTPVDFDAAFLGLERLSSALDALQESANWSQAWGTLTFKGVDEALNVFRIDGATIAASDTVIFDIPLGSSIVINVVGTELEFENKGFTLVGADSSRILWNAAKARSIMIGGVAFPGTMVAPDAAIDVRGAQVYGTVVGHTLTGASNSFHFVPLDVEAILGSVSPTSLTLLPTQPLTPGCTYRFLLRKDIPYTPDFSCLNTGVEVEFRVAQQETTPSERELTSVHLAPNESLESFSAKEGINTPTLEVWKRYEDILKLNGDELIESSFPRPSSFLAQAVQRRFDQYHEEYPVLGFGYFVQELDGSFRSARGQLVRELQPVSAPTVTEAQALDAVLALTGGSRPWQQSGSVWSPPTSKLQLVSRTGGHDPSDFELRWTFDFRGTGLAEPRSAHVTADDVSQVVLHGNAHSCFDGSPTFVDAHDATVLTAHNGARSIPVNEYDDNGVSRFVLETLGGSPLRRGFHRPAVLDTQWLCESDNSGVWDTGTEVEAATMFWGILEAEEYLIASTFALNGYPWITFDGGSRILDVEWVPAASVVPDCPADTGSGANTQVYDDDGEIGAVIRGYEGPQGSWVNPAAMAHEYAHAFHVWGRIEAGLPPLGVYRETGSIKEGFADLYAVAALRSRVPDDPFWPCIGAGDECRRDPSNPIALGNPDYFLEPPYVDYSSTPDFECGGICSDNSNGNCGIHANSTIVSHWGYLLGSGSEVGDPVCGALVEPLVVGDEVTSYRRVVDIAWHALVEQVGAAATFAEFRDATVYVASSLYPETDAKRKVEQAWHAVGIGGPPPPLSVKPEDGAVGVEPWFDHEPLIEWKTDGVGPWQVEIATQSDFCADDDDSCTVETHQVTSAQREDGEYAELWLKVLPGTKYYWRARRDGASEWTRCTIVAQSTFTTVAKKISLLDAWGKDYGRPTSIKGKKYNSNHLAEVLWELQVDGRTGYEVAISDSPLAAECDASSAKIIWQRWVTLARDQYNFWSDGIDGPIYPLLEHADSDKTYFLYVRPVSEDHDRVLRGTCSEVEVTYEPLGPLTGISPDNPDLVYLDLTSEEEPVFKFTKSASAQAYSLIVRYEPPQDLPTPAERADKVIYERARSVGSCNLVEKEGVFTWQVGACDGSSDLSVLDWMRPGLLYWQVIARSGEQYRSGWKLLDNVSGGTVGFGMFTVMPRHLPAKHSDSLNDGSPFWISIEDAQASTQLRFLEEGTITVNGSEAASVTYRYGKEIERDRDLAQSPLSFPVCLNLQNPFAKRVYLHIEGNGGTVVESGFVDLGSDQPSPYCVPVQVDQIGVGVVNVYAMPYNEIGETAEKWTQLRLSIIRADEPVEPEEDDEPEECHTPAAVVLTGLPAAAQPYGVGVPGDPDDACSVLSVHGFNQNSRIYELYYISAAFEHVEHATDYEMAVHPVAWDSFLETQDCRSTTTPWDGGSEQSMIYPKYDLPASDTGAYEFVVRGINNAGDCNEVGQWSNVGALQLIKQ